MLLSLLAQCFWSLQFSAPARRLAARRHGGRANALAIALVRLYEIGRVNVVDLQWPAISDYIFNC